MLLLLLLSCFNESLLVSSQAMQDFRVGIRRVVIESKIVELTALTCFNTSASAESARNTKSMMKRFGNYVGRLCSSLKYINQLDGLTP